jgi:ferric-dicitrate binding protein FerR (iron transport regulator)
MVLSTGPGGMAAIRLAGGPSLRVGVLTELTFSAARVVDLRHGDLYIDSGAGPAGGALPIEIRTPLGRVRDVGTQFALRLTDDALVVSVREGSAVLARAGRTYTAGAGTRLRAPASGAVETGTVAPRGSEWDWALGVAPPFEMEGRTLRDYIAWLSRETGWRVEFADPAAAPAALAVVLHGSTSGLRPDETPDAVLPACGLTYRRDGGTLLIESAGAGRHG